MDHRSAPLLTVGYPTYKAQDKNQDHYLSFSPLVRIRLHHSTATHDGHCNR